MTERKIRVLSVSDIHSVATLLDDLQEAVERHKPDILACVGDIIDFEARGRGMLPPSECGKRIAYLACSNVPQTRARAVCSRMEPAPA